jgi:hypothetical protein
MFRPRRLMHISGKELRRALQCGIFLNDHRNAAILIFTDGAIATALASCVVMMSPRNNKLVRRIIELHEP